MKGYTVKENPIGSADSEILRYKHTNTDTHRHPVTLLSRLQNFSKSGVRLPQKLFMLESYLTVKGIII